MTQPQTSQKIGPETTPAAQPEFNPSPRARFQATSGNITAHKSLLELPAFDRATDFAMLQLSSDLSANVLTMQDAAANGYRLEGAKLYLSCLKTLAAQPQASKRTPVADNLIPTDQPKRS